MERRSPMKKVLIYGGSGSVVSQVARLLHEKGYMLHLVGTNEERLSQVAESVGAEYTVADVTDHESIEKAATDAGKELHGLVYAVGTINLKSLRRLSADDFLTDFRINALGAAMAVQASLSALKKGGPGSSVVLYSSVAARQGFTMHGSIGMVKGAVEGLMVSLAAELAPGIRVNAVAPSLLDESTLSAEILKNPDTRESIASYHALQRLGTPGDIAAMTVFLLSSEASWITGQVMAVDGGRSVIV